MHKPVLLHESIEALNLSNRPGDDSGKILLDGTYGAGGHTREALRHYPEVRVIALDQDPLAVERAGRLDARIALYNANFRDLDQVLEKAGISSVDAILLDLGFSSDQIESSGRGFSFMREEPLDMRLSQEGITAGEILNNFSESALELILKGFGEEKFSRKIAQEIVRRRELKPFETTTDLVSAIEDVVPGSYRHGRIHPATRTFQALRIAVNEELKALEIGLEKAFQALAKEGRLAVISFHSLEDRIVKNFFRDRAKEGSATLINKKPITPSEEELRENPRARSAKLRVIQKHE